ncbi:hypothetical protein CI610_03073 [invertebrate metagenome]|uniref:Uncharacterized protein n=1 Tax=invertebrate metagenome TaxID=1711999 RepID=A0A2H9T459_9ZZZZ
MSQLMEGSVVIPPGTVSLGILRILMFKKKKKKKKVIVLLLKRVRERERERKKKEPCNWEKSELFLQG